MHIYWGKSLTNICEVHYDIVTYFSKSPLNAFLYFIAVAVAVIAITGQMVFCEDEKVGISSLHHLLWCAVTDDFEVRSKAVAMIIG